MYHANTNQQKVGVAILISDKVVFRKLQIQRVTLYDDKEVNPLRQQDNLKYVCIKQQSRNMYEVKTDRTERNRQSTMTTVRLHYFSLNDDRTRQKIRRI